MDETDELEGSGGSVRERTQTIVSTTYKLALAIGNLACAYRETRLRLGGRRESLYSRGGPQRDCGALVGHRRLSTATWTTLLMSGELTH